MAGSSTKKGSLREKSRSPAPPSPAQPPAQRKGKSYASEGVKDNDIFLLPAFDYQVMGVMTIVAAVVRLFRIYQPSSVVFDEVQ
jgi:dolichyl-phosphate-mannose-protein mannosyltransferase